jgi:hypothetical protein
MKDKVMVDNYCEQFEKNFDDLIMVDSKRKKILFLKIF